MKTFYQNAQWAVTSRGLCSTEYHYTLNVDQLGDVRDGWSDCVLHVCEIGWVKRVSFCDALDRAIRIHKIDVPFSVVGSLAQCNIRHGSGDSLDNTPEPPPRTKSFKALTLDDLLALPHEDPPRPTFSGYPLAKTRGFDLPIHYVNDEWAVTPYGMESKHAAIEMDRLGASRDGHSDLLTHICLKMWCKRVSFCDAFERALRIHKIDVPFTVVADLARLRPRDGMDALSNREYIQRPGPYDETIAGLSYVKASDLKDIQTRHRSITI